MRIADSKWRMVVVIGLMMGGMAIWVRGQVSNSQIIGQNYRYSMVVAGSEGEVEYVSFDPEEKKIMVIPWPSNLSISSRSVGSYQVGDLYKLGSYDGESGEWVRQKVQGYMKTPIMSYVAISGELGSLGKSLRAVLWGGSKVSQMSRLDALILILRSVGYEVKRVDISELIRVGVLSKSDNGYDYQEGRLQQFLGKRIFDWGVGQEEISVAVINTSEVRGLATDVASFIGNAGLIVVAVRSEIDDGRTTQVIISNELDETQSLRIQKMLNGWFGWEDISVGDTSEYRSEVVVKLGEDAEELF